MFLVGRIDLIAPLARLLIQILPTGKRAPRQKVVLDEPERPLHARRAVGMPELVSHKAKGKALGKGNHFRHRNHFAARAAQYHDVCVVDHDPFARA